jgi:hypothetical protein
MFIRCVILSVIAIIYYSSNVSNVWAASCCGGGSAANLVLPKFATSMYNTSMSSELYDGFWNSEGVHIPDPPGFEYKQHRVRIGGAYRLASRWQAQVSVPYVWNDNQSSSGRSMRNGIGDATIGLWYESFDDIKCVWRVNGWRDLIPALYLGANLTIPTGKSIHSNVSDFYDVTGRGFYRLDGTLLLDKTVYPWNITLRISYGRNMERAVNKERGQPIEPYEKRLGDRTSTSFSLGYTQFFDAMSTLTYTLFFVDLREGTGELNGQTDESVSGFKKQSIGLSLAYAVPDLDWIYKLSFHHALQVDGRGESFPTTHIINLGVSYVFR